MKLDKKTFPFKHFPIHFLLIFLPLDALNSRNSERHLQMNTK